MFKSWITYLVPTKPIWTYLFLNTFLLEFILHECCSIHYIPSATWNLEMISYINN